MHKSLLLLQYTKITLNQKSNHKLNSVAHINKNNNHNHLKVVQRLLIIGTSILAYSEAFILQIDTSNEKRRGR